MNCPPYVLQLSAGLWYWCRLSFDGDSILRRSEIGFATDEEARADFKWWNSTTG